MRRIITTTGPEGERRWLVRDAVSRRAAINEINHARALGSIGGRSDMDETHIGGTCYIIADVHEINSDYSLRQPYVKGY